MVIGPKGNNERKSKRHQKNNKVSNFNSAFSSVGEAIFAPTQLTTKVNKIPMKEKNQLLHLIPGALSAGGLFVRANSYHSPPLLMAHFLKRKHFLTCHTVNSGFNI
jgi:hypothetical protein